MSVITLMENNIDYNLKEITYLTSRWRSEVGKRIENEVIDALKSGKDFKCILNKYAFYSDAEYLNEEYPSELITGDDFFLDQYDLRGISLYEIEISSKLDLSEVALSHALFSNCTLNDIDFQLSKLSFTVFNDCTIDNARFDYSSLNNANFKNCNLSGSSFIDANLRSCCLSGSKFKNVYWKGSNLNEIELDHSTEIDLPLKNHFNGEKLQKNEINILMQFRIAYGNAELWDLMDAYLYEEKTKQRKLVLYENLKKKRSIVNFKKWIVSSLNGAVSGYSTKPIRVILFGLFVSTVYTVIYVLLGSPNSCLHESLTDSVLESIYFSFTTFATLGYGDLSYGEERPFMRILSTTEAWMGAIILALFVAIMARKYFK